MNHSKAQGLPVNMIILIALGVIVLIVLTVMFIRSSSKGNETINSCQNSGGKCRTPTACSGPNTQQNFLGKCPGTNDPPEATVCCISAEG